MLARSQQVPTPAVAAGLARQLRARDGYDVVLELASIAHETFVGCGRYDGLAPVANSELLADQMPNATMHVFEGGHLMTFQDPAAWSAVVGFLSR